MTAKKQEKMSYPVTPTQLTDVAHSDKMSYPLETRMDKGFQAVSVENSLESVSYPPSSKIPEFVSAKKAMLLMGSSWPTIKRHCKEGKFKGAQKVLIDGNESWQIPITSLPPEAQTKLAVEMHAAIVARASLIAPPAPVVSASHVAADARSMWDAWERSGPAAKEKTEKLFAAVSMFEELTLQGLSKGRAEKEVRAAHGVSKQTLWRARSVTNGHPVVEWLPRLSPNWTGGRPEAELTPDAETYILDAYLIQTKPPFAVVMEEARILAKVNGWTIPSDDAVMNRIKKLPADLVTLGRNGPKALERAQPATKRDYDMRLHELWESDGHRSDLVCIWPNGDIERPFVIVWRDVRSRMVLGVKGCINPSTDFAMAALCNAIERAGCAPDYAKLDNGREYASKAMTGGQKTRYRNSIKDDELVGILTRLGITVKWSKPGRGQDKAIEPWWKYGIDRADKYFRAGAYCGKDVMSKPENFNRNKPIPIAEYQARLSEIYERFNNEHQHSGNGMNGGTPASVYARLSAITARPAIDPAHLRMLKMGATQIRPGQGKIYALKINEYGTFRYYSEDAEKLSTYELGRKHDVFYHFGEPEKAVSVYLGKVFLFDAEYQPNLSFLDSPKEAAEHEEKKNRTMKKTKVVLKQINANAKALPLTLPPPAVVKALPPPAFTFDEKWKPPVIEAPVFDDPWEDTNEPGVQRHRETGRTRIDKFAQIIATSTPKDSPIEDDDEQRMEKRLREIDERQSRKLNATKN